MMSPHLNGKRVLAHVGAAIVLNGLLLIRLLDVIHASRRLLAIVPVAVLFEISAYPIGRKMALSSRRPARTAGRSMGLAFGIVVCGFLLVQLIPANPLGIAVQAMIFGWSIGVIAWSPKYD